MEIVVLCIIFSVCLLSAVSYIKKSLTQGDSCHCESQTCHKDLPSKKCNSLKVLLFLGMVYLFSSTTFASMALNPQPEEWDPPSAGPATTETAPLCEKNKLVVQPFFIYNHTRGTFDTKGKYNSLPNDDQKFQYQQILFIQYGLSDRLEVDGQLLYQENRIKTDGIRAHQSGLSDSAVFLKYCLLEEKNWWPHISSIFELKMPTGKYQKADPEKLGADIMGTGAWEHGYGLIMTKKLRPFIVHMDGILGFPQPVDVDGIKTRYGNSLTLDTAVEYFFGDHWNLLFEVNHFRQKNTREAGDMVPGSRNSSTIVGPGIGWSNDKVQCLLSFQRTVSGVNADANNSAIFTTVYSF